MEQKKGDIMDFKELGENLGLEEDEYMELVELLVDTGKVDVQKLKTAIEQGDSDEAGNAAHSLKGASGNLGIMNIFEVAKQCEEAARNHLMEDLTPLVKKIEDMLETLSIAAGM
jgi:HPt (histidine-containing phosphotransfer) domain-containing protein